MTGGYLESRRSRMGAQAEIVRLSAEVERLDNELLQAQEALNQVDVRVTNVMGELHRHAPRATELSRSPSISLAPQLSPNTPYRHPRPYPRLPQSRACDAEGPGLG